jgi:nickel-type superoxide dismutase maturation protease
MRLPIRIFHVRDRSMEPAIMDGDYVLVSALHSRLRNGDVVILPHPKTGLYLIKRVSGIKGDSLFVLGDNAKLSDDSRSFGYVKSCEIIGKVIYKV